jgi:hypothetical protein
VGDHGGGAPYRILSPDRTTPAGAAETSTASYRRRTWGTVVSKSPVRPSLVPHRCVRPSSDSRPPASVDEWPISRDAGRDQRSATPAPGRVVGRTDTGQSRRRLGRGPVRSAWLPTVSTDESVVSSVHYVRTAVTPVRSPAGLGLSVPRVRWAWLGCPADAGPGLRSGPARHARRSWDRERIVRLGILAGG